MIKPIKFIKRTYKYDDGDVVNCNPVYKEDLEKIYLSSDGSYYIVKKESTARIEDITQDEFKEWYIEQEVKKGLGFLFEIKSE